MRALFGTLVWFGAGISITAGLVHVMTARATAPHSQGVAIEEAQLRQAASLGRRRIPVNESVQPKPR